MTTQPSPQNPLVEVVSMNYRYISAWNEVNTRISLRQNVVTLFVALSGAVITLLSSKLDINIEMLSALMPCVAVASALLYKKHDDTIALLRSFLVECEIFHSEQYQDLMLMGYNSSDHYLGIAHSIRKLHDVTFLILVTLFNVVGGYVAYAASQDHRTDGILIAIYGLAAIAPWFILYARFGRCPSCHSNETLQRATRVKP